MTAPLLDGLAASNLQLPPGPWRTVLDCLCARFTRITREQWLERMARGRVLRADGTPIGPNCAYRLGLEIHYYREVADEPVIPFTETLVHVDAHLVIADKPHFLPVTPGGAFVRETLLARLIKRLDNPELAPLHRIDRATAGLVVFSANSATRSRYQALFREHRAQKNYLAVAPPLLILQFPLTRCSRLESGEPFFRMQEVAGPANSESRIDVLERGDEAWCYALQPVSGKTHQLRVHMAALGAPIVNDPYYPVLAERAADDYQRPLQLLAQRLEFVDPLDGSRRRFESGLQLSCIPRSG